MNLMQSISAMMNFDFKLNFALPESGEDPERYLAALSHRCNDATIGIGAAGRIGLDFSREARSAEAAMLSAFNDIVRAIPGVTLIEASPDLVGLTDLADILGCSRQNMRKLQLSNAATFPPPVHDGSSALWHLAQVLEWYQQEKGKVVEPALLQTAHAALQLNLARDSRLLDARFQRRLKLA